MAPDRMRNESSTDPPATGQPDQIRSVSDGAGSV